MEKDAIINYKDFQLVLCSWNGSYIKYITCFLILLYNCG